MTTVALFLGGNSLAPHPIPFPNGRPKADADYPPEVVSKTPEKATPQLAAQVAPQAPPAKQVTAKHVPAPSLGRLLPTGGNVRVGICLGCYGIYIYV